MRTTTWLYNQELSIKMYEELCDMKGMHPFGGEQRCPFCKTRRRFVDKKQGHYSFAIKCTVCRKVISPLSQTLFAHTKTHLSVWMKAVYILRIKQPDILLKDLAASLNVGLITVRRMRNLIRKLKKNSFEMHLLKRLEPLIAENFTLIFSEHPMQSAEK